MYVSQIAKLCFTKLCYDRLYIINRNVPALGRFVYSDELLLMAPVNSVSERRKSHLRNKKPAGFVLIYPLGL